MQRGYNGRHVCVIVCDGNKAEHVSQPASCERADGVGIAPRLRESAYFLIGVAALRQANHEKSKGRGVRTARRGGGCLRHGSSEVTPKRRSRAAHPDAMR